MNNFTIRKIKSARFTAFLLAVGIFIAALIGVSVLGFNKTMTAHGDTTGKTKIDVSNVDWVPVFVNTASPYYKAHGDITSVYKHNDGWYPSQKADEVPVEIRTITNAYYYETNYVDKSNLISIKLANEKLTGVENKNAGDLTDEEKQIKTSTLKYSNDLTFEITDRAGVAFTTSNEYIATFTFHIPQNKQDTYYFDYGNKTEDDEIKDANKGLSITQRTPTSFVLSKHWFIVKSSDLFMAVGDTASFPYVPFHDNNKLEAANGLTNITEGNIEGIRGETNTATDTVSYTEAFTVKPPIVKLGGVNGTIKFEITYVDLSGNKHKIIQDPIQLDATPNAVNQNTLNYYFNETMPAGHYTLKLYGIKDINNPNSDRIIGEYWLTVLPKEINSTLVGNFQTAIQGDSDVTAAENAVGFYKYANSFLLSDNKIHKDLTAETTALNNSLNDTLNNATAGSSYWVGKTQYYDSSVTVTYNRDSWSSSAYVPLNGISLTTQGTYIIYYSISAKNYVTVGGANDANRTNYGFRTKLSTGIKVSEILIDPYFKDVTYSGEEAKTSVPQKPYYDISFGDSEYVNVGTHTVTLTLNDSLTSWDTEGATGNFEIDSEDNSKLIVYFDITAADNGWNVMPQMPSWAFNGFDKDVNAVTAGLKFNSTVKYALIPTTVSDPLAVGWEDGTAGVAFFTVNNGIVDDKRTAAQLNSLKPASYYLKFFVSEVVVTVTEDGTSKQIKNVNAYEDIARNSSGEPMATVTVAKATNSWTSTPNVTRWTFGEYDPQIHTITAEALYPALLPKDEKGENITGFSYGTNPPEVQFTVYNGNTVVTDYSTLHAGTYVLATSMGGTDYYTAIAETRMNFEVGKAVNTWTTTPQVVQWTWGNYAADRNIISAEAKFTGGDGSTDSTDKPILFTVFEVVDGNRTAVDKLEKFQVGSNGRITNTEAAKAFAELHAGNYYLRAEKLGNNDYSDITGSNNTDIPFTVRQAANSWTTSPSIIGWVYGSYSDEYFTLGVPTFKGSGKVKYTLTKTNDSKFEQIEFTDRDDIDFTALNVGSYKLTAVYAGTVDFDKLEADMTFTVSEYTNGWNPSPSLRGWSYKSFNSGLFTAGEPTLKESKNADDTDAVVTYEITGGKLTNGVTLTVNADGTLSADSITALTNLVAGSYTLKAAYAGTVNYKAITASIDFEVTKIANSWKTTPSIIGWVYGSYFDEYFTPGVPTFNESKNPDSTPAKVTYTITKTDDADFTEIKFTDRTEVKFIEFDAGRYSVDVFYASSDDYGELTATITFNVVSVNNSWDTQPIITGFVYEQFLADNNFVAGVPHCPLNNKTAYYVIADSAISEVKTLEDFEKITGKHFTLNGTGSLGKDISDYLNGLGNGTYYFAVFVPADTNYTHLFYPGSFGVSQTGNNWKDGVSPDISGWTYNGFTASLFTTGTPEHGKVTYTVTKSKGQTAEIGGTKLENLSYEILKGLFNGLNADTYILNATSGQTNDYLAVTWSKPFAVEKADNAWQTYPSINGWTYGSNPATPTYGVAQHLPSGQITYTYYTASRVSSGLVANTALDPVTISSATPAGDYAMVVFAPASDNYKPMTYTAFFTVSKLTTVWDTDTTADNGESFNWIYKATDNETLNAPVLGNWAEGEIAYTILNDNSAQIYSGSDWSGTNGVIKTLEKQTAGTYVINANVTGDNNHTNLSYSVTLVVSVAPNEWVKKGANLTVEYGSTITIEYVPKHNEELMTIKVNNSTVDDLDEYFTLRGVGTYTISVTVDADLAYGALEDTITVTITRTSNGWADNTKLEIIQKDSDQQTTTNWVWGDLVQNLDDGVGVIAPIPRNGNKVIITVTRGGSEQFTATLNYEDTTNRKVVNANDFDALIAKLRVLSVGTYSIVAEIPESADYSAYAQEAFDFTVEKATNSWIKEPDIIGWNYNSTTAYPDATPRYGNKNDVEYSYVAKGEYATAEDVPETEWQATQPIEGGVYYLRGILHGTDNYDEIVGYCTFSIGTGENAWVNMPGVIAWTWNNYNKGINQFSGSARSGGVVKFTINKYGKSGLEALGKEDLSDTSLNEKLLQSFTFVIGSDGKATKYISDDVAKVLNALKPGKYNLDAIVVADENYQSIKGNIDFEVGRANNEWTTAPNMLSYSFGATVAGGDRQIFTEGKAKYGSTVNYEISGTENGSTKEIILNNLFASDINKLINGQYKENNKTVILNAGNYVLKAWVDEGSNYNAFYSQMFPYSVLFGVTRIENEWKENKKPQPSIDQYYAELQKNTFKFNDWFVAPQTIYDDKIFYTLLNTDDTVAKAGEFEYGDELFGAIKGLSAGDYVIRMTVKESVNCWALTADTRLSIQRYSNEFTSFPTKNLSGQWQLSGAWKPTDNVNATTLDSFTVTAKQGNDTITYTINGVKCETLAKLKEEVAKLNAGSYQVTVAVAQTDSYEGISRTAQLDIKQGKNEFVWSISPAWVWNNGKGENNHFSASGLKYGNQVSVEINKAGVSAAISYIVVDLTQPLMVVNSILGGLDAGTYTVTVTAKADEDGNWAEVSDTGTFTIDKAGNSWKTAPYIAGAKDNKWAHGDTVVPAAEAQYGSVRFEYETKAGDKLTSMPVTCGEYVIKFIVDNSTNYGGTSGSLNVTIEKANNRNFSVALGVDGWAWGSYDRATNVFRGTPEITDLENAAVKFSVGTGTGDDFVALPDLAEFSLNSFGLVEANSKVEAALCALTGGTSAQNNRTTYTLRIHVGGTTNYNPFVQDNTFAVTGATNLWIQTPTVVPWIVNSWTDENIPSAVALYGAPEITITREADGTVYYKGAYVETENGLVLVEEFNNLNLAPEGYYVMTTYVKEEAGHYNSPLTASFRFRINVKGIGETNHWEELPSIDGWVANIDGLYNLPAGKPLRGLPNFVFYVRNEDGTRGQKVDASLSDVVLKKGTKYEADIYIPLENGNYIMVASSKGSPTEDGKSDALAEYEIRVIIEARPIAFEEELRISTLLYLGDRANWADPTSKATVADAVYEYVYTNKDTGETSSEKPTEPGAYSVTATISAKYANSVSMSVDFTVELSPNSWIAAPSIKDWSAEYGPNEPTGSASVGGDEIKYTYASVDDPDNKRTEPPTDEGTYILYADVDVKGYEPLHAEYIFTIEPAFDNDLLIVDIILGLVACGLTIAVIYYAVKRYKEN